MSSMLRYLCAALALLMMLGGFAACQPAGGPADTTADGSSDESAATNPETNPETVPESGAVTDGETSAQAPDQPQAPATRPAQEVKVISMNLDANEATAGSRVRLMAPLLLSF